MRKFIATVAAIILVVGSFAGVVRAEGSVSPDSGAVVSMQPTDTPLDTLVPVASAAGSPQAPPPTARPTVQFVPTAPPVADATPTDQPSDPPSAGPAATPAPSTIPSPTFEPCGNACNLPSPEPTAEPTPVPTPQAIETGAVSNWSGSGPAVITVPETQWVALTVSWSCITSTTFAFEPLFSFSSSGGPTSGFLGPITPLTSLPPLGRVTMAGGDDCSWHLSVSFGDDAGGSKASASSN